MDIYSIYKITNTINEKIYIGFTNNFERRIVEHTRNSRKLNSHLYYAIKKYGIDKFTFEIIYQSLEGDYLKNAMETYFINLYDSYHSGYNMTIGGDGTLGRLWTDKQKQMISIRNKGQLSNNKGKTYIELYGEEKALEKINKLKKTWIYKESLKPMKIIHKLSLIHISEPTRQIH
jgi:group I intron endonuclease